MKRGKKNYSAALIALLLCMFSVAEPVRSEVLKVGGTGFGLGAMKILAATFESSQPGVNIEVLRSLGSSGGIQALLHGALDIALSGRPLKASESGKKIVATQLARSPFIFIVNKNVAKGGITFKEFEKILRGELLAWSDGVRIRPVLRPESDAATKTIRQISSDMNQAVTIAMNREGMIRAITDQESLEAVEKTPGALASCTLTQVLSEKRQVGILALDGIEPSTRGISDGSYPLSVPLYIVTPVKIPGSSQKFLDFIYSENGNKILTENGNLLIRASRIAK